MVSVVLSGAPYSIVVLFRCSELCYFAGISSYILTACSFRLLVVLSWTFLLSLSFYLAARRPI